MIIDVLKESRLKGILDDFLIFL